ncbi:hypothetical protein RZS08_27135, partial [Arthrospira platensis SPKY1]|nr:hypothetical protein [Arthrospira platensis SPKY1]
MDGISTPSETCWPRGGFPESLLAASDAESLDWRRDLIRSYLEREVPMFAPRLPAETIGRLWIMLAHQQGALLNQARLAVSLGASVPYPGPYPLPHNETSAGPAGSDPVPASSPWRPHRG